MNSQIPSSTSQLVAFGRVCPYGRSFSPSILIFERLGAFPFPGTRKFPRFQSTVQQQNSLHFGNMEGYTAAN
jgi:hypothetical protein